MPSILLLLACAGGDAAPHSAGALTFDGPPPTNLLIIGVDTLRRDYVGRYGGGDRAPFLDALLERSVALDAHRSCSNWTFSASLCLGAGQGQLEMGFTPSISQAIPAEITLLAQRLRGQGYSTGLISANTFLGDAVGYDRGFDVARVMDPPRSADQVTAEGLRVLSQLLEGDAPWFLQLHYMEPHDPYDPDEAWDESGALDPIDYDLSDPVTWEKISTDWWTLPEDERALLLQHLDALYGGEVRTWDAALEALWGALEDTEGALEDTLVLIWSDHGEQFWEHGQSTHGYGLYAEENLAIASFWASDLAPTAWNGATTHADLAPTILAALGREVPEAMTGQVAGTAPEDQILTALRFHGELIEGTSQVAERGGLRLHFTWDGTLEAFDLSADPEERSDRLDPADPEQQALWSELEARALELQSLNGSPSPVWPGW